VPRYERLRASVLGTSPRREAGWAVFLRRGRWAWCQTTDERPSAVPASVADPPPRPVPAAETPLIQVLASRVLAVQQESDHDD
jgi:hypothetical protein